MSRENPPVIVLNADGSYTRPISFPISLPTPDLDSNNPVLSKDATINHINKTWCRIHIPKESITTTTEEKLPLIVYFRGGGFIITNADTTIIHEFCDQLAAHLRAVVVHVDYRNAPEHRLPAAYEDAIEALHWLKLKSTQDPWLTKFVDFSKCYLMGSSAGANIVYHAGLHVSQCLNDIEPLVIKGLILHNIFIGGEARTESEIRMASTGVRFTLSLSDTMWDFALPVGASRDHKYSNLMLGNLDDMCRIKDAGWQVLMYLHHGDLLIDRQIEFAKTLELKGVECTTLFSEDEHGIEYFDKAKAIELYEEISRFISSVNGSK